MLLKVTLAAAVVFSYAWVAPAVVYAVMKFASLGRGSVGLWDVVCLYGYSMCVFVPATLVLMVQGWRDSFSSGVTIWYTKQIPKNIFITNVTCFN